MLQGGTFEGGILYVGNEAGSNGAITLEIGSLKVSLVSSIGVGGTGNVTMNIGLFEVALMEIGSESTGVGTVSVVDASLKVTQRLTVGGNGIGTLIVGPGATANVGRRICLLIISGNCVSGRAGS